MVIIIFFCRIDDEDRKPLGCENLVLSKHDRDLTVNEICDFIMNNKDKLFDTTNGKTEININTINIRIGK